MPSAVAHRPSPSCSTTLFSVYFKLAECGNFEGSCATSASRNLSMKPFKQVRSQELEAAAAGTAATAAAAVRLRKTRGTAKTISAAAENMNPNLRIIPLNKCNAYAKIYTRTTVE